MVNLVSPLQTIGGGSQRQFMNSFEDSSDNAQMNELYRQKMAELQALEAKMATLSPQRQQPEGQGTLAFGATNQSLDNTEVRRRLISEESKSVGPGKLMSSSNA